MAEAPLSIKAMKEKIQEAGLPTADLLERAQLEERYAAAVARLAEAARIQAERAERPAAQAATPNRTSPPPTRVTPGAAAEGITFPTPSNDGVADCCSELTIVKSGKFPQWGDPDGPNEKNQGRDKLKALVEVFGGTFRTAVSGKTDIMIVGKEPGEVSVAKATWTDRCKFMSLEDFLEGLRQGDVLERAKAWEDFNYEGEWSGPWKRKRTDEDLTRERKRKAKLKTIDGLVQELGTIVGADAAATAKVKKIRAELERVADDDYSDDEAPAGSLSDFQQRVLDYFEQHELETEGINVTRVATGLGANSAEVQEAVTFLLEKAYINTTKPNHYRVDV